RDGIQPHPHRSHHDRHVLPTPGHQSDDPPQTHPPPRPDRDLREATAPAPTPRLALGTGLDQVLRRRLRHPSHADLTHNLPPLQPQPQWKSRTDRQLPHAHTPNALTPGATTRLITDRWIEAKRLTELRRPALPAVPQGQGAG